MADQANRLVNLSTARQAIEDFERARNRLAQIDPLGLSDLEAGWDPADTTFLAGRDWFDPLFPPSRADVQRAFSITYNRTQQIQIRINNRHMVVPGVWEPTSKRRLF